MGRVLGPARQHKNRKGVTTAAPCLAASEMPCKCCRPSCMLQVCCEVLQRVRQEAEARNAGIIFLGKHLNLVAVMTAPCFSRRGRQKASTADRMNDAGDFWHARGALPVTPLNLVIQELRQWRQPTLMLVGNHDQVPTATHHRPIKPASLASVRPLNRP